MIDIFDKLSDGERVALSAARAVDKGNDALVSGNRYVLQMSEFQAYHLALYDTEKAEVVAQFKTEELAERAKAALNLTG